MSESKTIVFGNDSNNGMLGLLAPLLQQRNLDPNAVLAMMNNRNNNGFGGEGGWFMWVIFLFFLMGWGGNGFGGFGRNGGALAGDAALANMINNDQGRDLLMQAIQGNANAISQLASTTQCSFGQVQQAINAVAGTVQQVGNQVGLTGQQIINAVQAGDCNLAHQIADCCCENRLAICQQTNTLQNSINTVNNSVERGFASTNFETQRQTCSIEKSIAESTEKLLAGQRAAEMREMQREIAERDRTIAKQDVIINNGQQTAIFGQMINQATAPIAAAVGGLQKDVDGIKCKLPETTTIQYSPVVGVPTCVAANYGLGYGLNGWGAFGFNGWG